MEKEIRSLYSDYREGRLTRRNFLKKLAVVTGSAAAAAALFAGFFARMAESDFSGSFIIGFGSSPSRCGPPAGTGADGQPGDLPVPEQGACMHARFFDHAGSHGHLR